MFKIDLTRLLLRIHLDLRHHSIVQGGGLDTMVLSPDEELLLLVTPQTKAILMTREFDPIAEVDVDTSQDESNQVRIYSSTNSDEYLVSSE